MYRGQDVAVKVRHPQVELQIRMDYDIMIAVATVVDMIPGLEWLELANSMTQFKDTIAAQTDLRTEAHYLRRFQENFRDMPEFLFPTPILVSSGVLVESYLPGHSVALLYENPPGEVTPRDGAYPRKAHFTVTRGEDLYLKMLLQDNLMHADLHPGNILLDAPDPGPSADALALSGELPQWDDAKSGSIPARSRTQYRIGLVDAGLVAVLTSEQRRNFIGLLEALGEGDGRQAADCVLRFARHAGQDLHQAAQQDAARRNVRQEPDAHRDEAFRSDMAQLFAAICRGYGTNVDLGAVLRGILTLVRKHRVTLEANYATLVMNALCLDGMAKVLLPSYNVLDAAKPLLRLHRVCKRLPFGLADPVIKFAYPVITKAKAMYDGLHSRRAVY
jgi:aarF domain-containing kinase